MANLGYAENPQPLWVFGGRRVAPGQRPPLTTRTPSRPWISGAWASWPVTSAPTDPCVSALSLLCRPFPLRSLHPWVGVAPHTSPPRQSYRVSPPSQIWPSPCGPAVNSPQSQRFRLGSPEWGPICSELRAHLRTLNPGGLGLQCRVLPHNLPVWALVRPVRAEREAGPGVSPLPARPFSCMAQDPDLVGYAVHP